MKTETKAKPSDKRRVCDMCDTVLRSGNITKRCSLCTYKVSSEIIRSGGTISKRGKTTPAKAGAKFRTRGRA